MGNSIKPKRSYTANSVPLTTDLEVNELAIRWDASSPAIFTKNASGQIVTVALGGSSGGGSSSLVTAATVAGFPATGSTANLYVATDTNRIYRWDSANSIYVELGPLASSGDTLLRSYLVPTAPTNVTATAGNAQVALSWTAASSLSQIPVTDYLIQQSTDNGTTWTLASDTVSTATSATITGLTNGTAYRWRVAAVNGVGTGAYSTASSAVTPGNVDPFFSSVALLLHMGGSNGSTTFTDSSGTPKTVAATGGAQISTAQSKFGGSSLFVNGGYLTTPRSAFEFGTADFVIEMWLYSTATGGFKTALSNYTSFTSGNLLLARSAGGAFTGKWYAINNGVYPPDLASSTNATDNAWEYVALVRNGGTLTLYVNGVAEATKNVSGVSLSGNGSNLWIGTAGDSPSDTQFSGYIDELRITMNSNRGYTGATIPVPTAAFPDA